MNNTIVISNREPQQISIGGGGQVIGISKVLVNGIDVTEGSVAYVVVPTKLSELLNDTGFINHEVDPTVPYYVKQITQADINRWNNKQEVLVSGVNIKTINDNNILGSGNIDISTSYTAGTGIEITEENVINNTITSYDDLTDLPTIPTKTSDLLNDSGYIIADQLADVAFSGDYMDLNNTPTIPTATSDLLNDSGYITKEVNDLENYFNYDYLYNYVLPKVSDSDTNISLNGTMPNLPLNITLSPSELSQSGTPSPSSPQDIHTISGSNTIKVEGQNLFSLKDWLNYSNASYTENNDGSITFTVNSALYTNTFPITEVERATFTYKITNGTGTNFRFRYVYDDGTVNETPGSGTGTSEQTLSNTSSIGRGNLVGIAGNWSNSGTFTIKEAMLEIFQEGITTPYTPYVSQEADIDLGDIEYCEIDNYKDRIFKNVSGDTDYSSELDEGAWYIKKNIGKVVLDGSEAWNYSSGSATFYVDIANLNFATSNNVPLSTHYKGHTNVAGTGYLADFELAFLNSSSPSRLYLKDSNYTDTTNYKNWLSSNNVIIDYVLATPTYTKITGTLAEQLEEVYNNLKSYNEQTNISQINNDLPFVVNATTLKSLNNL